MRRTLVGCRAPTRWAGVPLLDRRAERRAPPDRRGVRAVRRRRRGRGVGALGLPGVRPEHAVLLRELRRRQRTPRRDVRPRQPLELGAAVEAAMLTADDDPARPDPGGHGGGARASAPPTRAGADCCSPTPPPTPCSPSAAPRPRGSASSWWSTEDCTTAPAGRPRRRRGSGAALYTGAMTELAQQWLAGRLGDDVDARRRPCAQPHPLRPTKWLLSMPRERPLRRSRRDAEPTSVTPRPSTYADSLCRRRRSGRGTPHPGPAPSPVSPDLSRHLRPEAPSADPARSDRRCRPDVHHPR